MLTAVADIAKELEEINESGENKFNLEFSYGIAVITPDNSPDVFLNTMDSRMYEMKKGRKAGH